MWQWWNISVNANQIIFHVVQTKNYFSLTSDIDTNEWISIRIFLSAIALERYYFDISVQAKHCPGFYSKKKVRRNLHQMIDGNDRI